MVSRVISSLNFLSSSSTLLKPDDKFGNCNLSVVLVFFSTLSSILNWIFLNLKAFSSSFESSLDEIMQSVIWSFSTNSLQYLQNLTKMMVATFLCYVLLPFFPYLKFDKYLVQRIYLDQSDLFKNLIQIFLQFNTTDFIKANNSETKIPLFKHSFKKLLVADSINLCAENSFISSDTNITSEKEEIDKIPLAK